MKKIFASTLIALTLITIGCSQTATTSEEKQVLGPAIEFEFTEHDYGTIQKGGDGNVDFTFTNSGVEPLILSNVRSSCGCTVPQWPREPINAGESATIKVKYDTKRVGSFSKSISVYSNATEAPVVLRIRGKVEDNAAAPAPAEE